jgi:type IV pilus assembly protein PilC
MPVYLWQGQDRKGGSQKGELEAPDEAAVRVQLRRMQVKPSKIKKKPKDLFENVSFLQPKVPHSVS